MCVNIGDNQVNAKAADALGPVSESDKTCCRKISWELLSRETCSSNNRIALMFNRHNGSTADVPVKSQSDHTSLHTNL